ncbi:hypothetical protein COCON_G00094230 [Conger conger]|uniref:Uncharacterized protein n=1 Tax=Conger conger TaxID=82655 RepID=A0A9Q1DLL7_CONCO|nr:hypothetical protein COCON_G00094230 [Conger conger]
MTTYSIRVLSEFSLRSGEPTGYPRVARQSRNTNVSVGSAASGAASLWFPKWLTFLLHGSELTSLPSGLQSLRRR